MNRTMDCQAFTAELDRYLDNELSGAEREVFLRHTKECPECAEKLEIATRLMTMCAEMDEGLLMPLDGQAAWRRAIRLESHKKQKSSVRGWVRALGTIAAAMALLVGGTFAYRNMGPLSPSAVNTTINEVAPLYMQDEMEASDTSNPFMDLGSPSPRTRLITKTDGPVDDVDSDTGISDALGNNDVSVPAPMPDDGATGVDPSVPKDQVRVIRSASRSIESISFDSDCEAIRDLVSEYEGLIEDYGSYGSPIEPGQNYGRNAYFYVRVPTGDLDTFLRALDAVGTTVARSENSQDISAQYYDMVTRLENQKALRAKMQALISQAQTIDEIISIEDKLADAQAQIDSMEGTIRGWDSRVNLSGVDISLREVADPSQVQPIDSGTLMDRVRAGFAKSINLFSAFMQDLLVFVVIAWPWLVILIVLIIIVSVVVRRRRRR